MSETNNCEIGTGNFKEAVCIDAGRVYDSCCDRDCLEDVRFFFTSEAQNYVNQAISVRLKSAEILNVFIDVEPVSFNKGFYSCDLTFFFLMNFRNTSFAPSLSYWKGTILWGFICPASFPL